MLALFIPIVTATAGSVGMQSLAAALGAFQEDRRPVIPCAGRCERLATVSCWDWPAG